MPRKDANPNLIKRLFPSKLRFVSKTSETVKPGQSKHPTGPHSGAKIAWLPDQKGAWMMVVVPFLTGMFGGGATWRHALLGAFWICGYALFFTGDNWLRYRRRPAYLPPVYLWLGLSAAFGIATLVTAFDLLPWALVYAPLVAIAVWGSLTHQARSLSSRSATVIAAGLMCLVSWDLGATDLSFLTVFNSPLGHRPVLVTLLVGYYFWTTIPYVKSILRERNNPRYLYISAAVHLVGMVFSFVLGVTALTTWWPLVFWLVLSLRAAGFTWLSRQVFAPKNPAPGTQAEDQENPPHRTIAVPKPKTFIVTVGVFETVLSLLYIPCVLL